MKINITNTQHIEIVAHENIQRFEVNGVLVPLNEMSELLAALVVECGMPDQIIYDFNNGMINNGQGIGSLVCHENADKITAGAFRIIDGE